MGTPPKEILLASFAGAILFSALLFSQPLARKFRVLCVTPEGRIIQCELSGISVLGTVSKPTLYVPSGGSGSNGTLEREQRTLSVDTLTFTLTFVPTEEVQAYRNGLLQEESYDFDVSGKVLTFRTASKPLAGDRMQFFYRH